MAKNRYRTAAICQRGHVLSVVNEADSVGARCRTCGAAILTECPACQTRVQGQRERFLALFEGGPALPSWEPYEEEYERPSFCGVCGNPYPWVGRQERIWEIENRLDLDGLDPGTALALREQLEALGEGEEDEDTQTRRWKRVFDLVPNFWERSGVKEIAVTVMTEVTKKQLGL
jgi:hypothetical protein